MFTCERLLYVAQQAIDTGNLVSAEAALRAALRLAEAQGSSSTDIGKILVELHAVLRTQGKDAEANACSEAILNNVDKPSQWLNLQSTVDEGWLQPEALRRTEWKLRTRSLSRDEAKVINSWF